MAADPVPVGQIASEVHQGIRSGGQCLHLGELAQHIAPCHGWQLLGVAGQYQLGTRLRCQLEQLLHHIKPRHAGLIHKHHAIAVQCLAARLQVQQQPVNGRGGNPQFPSESSGGLVGGCHPQNLSALRSENFLDELGRCRLAHPGPCNLHTQLPIPTCRLQHRPQLEIPQRKRFATAGHTGRRQATLRIRDDAHRQFLVHPIARRLQQGWNGLAKQPGFPRPQAVGGEHRFSKPIQARQVTRLGWRIRIHHLQEIRTAQQGAHARLDIGVQIQSFLSRLLLHPDKLGVFPQQLADVR